MATSLPAGRLPGNATLEGANTIVVSDFHIGRAQPPPPAASPGDGCSTERALATFLDWLGARARAEAQPWRLLILGDFLDLLYAPTKASSRETTHGTDLGSAEAALEGIAAAHTSALAALGAYAGAGNPVAIVPGNHDSELLDPYLQRRFGELVSELAGRNGGAPSLSFHPWFFLLPGVVYAEHGSQYHAINAVRNPLAPSGRWSSEPPLGALLDLHRLNLQERSARAPVRAGLATALVGRLGRRALSARRRTRDHGAAAAALARRAGETGLTPEALAALNGLARASATGIMQNALTALRSGPSRVPALQEAAAASIHDLLLAEQKAVPFYIFGHTHRPACTMVPATGSTLHCFNSGSWSTVPQPASGDSAVDRYTFVEIRRASDTVTATLRRWDTEMLTATTIAAPELAVAG
jgi:UDP-2,3-diacylglucosamine pyrophosphatase LpxH